MTLCCLGELCRKIVNREMLLKWSIFLHIFQIHFFITAMMQSSNHQPTIRLSEYARNLPKDNPNCYKRYVEKIKIISYNDPYLLDLKKTQLPTNVTTGHVVEYLLNYRSPYTGNPMKNHRSLEGYRKYEAGFVSSVSGQMINNSYIVLAKVSNEH